MKRVGCWVGGGGPGCAVPRACHDFWIGKFGLIHSFEWFLVRATRAPTHQGPRPTRPTAVYWDCRAVTINGKHQLNVLAQVRANEFISLHLLIGQSGRGSWV